MNTNNFSDNTKKPKKTTVHVSDTPPFVPTDSCAADIASECNPDNNAFFEKYSNPLSSKGN